ETARLEIVCALVVPGVRIPPSPLVDDAGPDTQRHMLISRRPPRRRFAARYGAVTEWLKVHAWNACVGFTPYRGFESLPLRFSSTARVAACPAPGRSVRSIRSSRRDVGRWWLGPAQDGVANPVRSGRKQRYRLSLCAAGGPSYHRRASRPA